MSAAHTPGPWFVANGSQFYVSNGPSWIACAVGIRGEEGEANARLMAAAPELLAVATRMLPANVCITNPNIRDDLVVPMEVTMGELRKIAAAVAKATKEPS